MLYEDVHSFLKQRKWAPAQMDTEAGGITWIELFILFDITGSRSQEGQHQKSPAATRRAEKRKGETKDAKGKKVNRGATTVVSKPTLDEDLKTFKVITRHIAKFEIEQQTIKRFQAIIGQS